MLEVTEHKGDLLIRDLWQQGTDSVHNMRVVNNDALSYVRKTPEKCLNKAGLDFVLLMAQPEYIRGLLHT